MLLGGGLAAFRGRRSCPCRHTESVCTEPSGVAAGFWWADFNGDGLQDAYAIGTSGAGRLLRNQGDGSFEDVTLISGSGCESRLASLAVWYDFDAGRAPGLCSSGAQAGSHLMRNAGDGTFQDVTTSIRSSRGCCCVSRASP